MQFIDVILENVPFIMVATAILLGAVLGLVARSKRVMVESMIRYMMLLVVGASSLWMAISYLLFIIDAPFFRFELTALYVGLGVAGIIGFKQNFSYWFAIAIVETFFLWGAAVENLYQIMLSSCYAVLGNIWMIFYMNLIIPLFLNFLLYYYYRHFYRQTMAS